MSEGQKKGEHTLVFQTSEPLYENERILLQGEFDVDLKCEKDYSVYASGTQYNLLKYLPEKMLLAEHIFFRLKLPIQWQMQWNTTEHHQELQKEQR